MRVHDVSDNPTSPPLDPSAAGADASRASVIALPVPPPVATEPRASPAQWGMIAFLASEASLFSTLIVAYLSFMGKDKVGPTPAEALSLPLVVGTTVCLLSSSATIHRSESLLRLGNLTGFCRWWGATIALGVIFLLGTAYEWFELITRHHLTISRNLFGTTYYTLVGFHGMHVTVGLIVMLTLLALVVRRRLSVSNRVGIELASWYWHFVDCVWVVVFTVVYLVGR
ncbi:MAG TPA: cytochrome c oxidase subunit 3 [Isosphaeraceae bacterium]|nr:cytochrome c oxidase subunit 3 [Isosphaeraceae bacterium]